MTEFAQACVPTEILCRNRAHYWDGKGVHDKARDHAHDARNSAHCVRDSKQSVQCARSCGRDRPAIVYCACTVWVTIHGHYSRTMFMGTVKKKKRVQNFDPRELGCHNSPN